MPANITSDQVWREVEKQIFAVLAFVNPRGEARTAGIVYTVRHGEIFIITGRNTWKARHIAKNPRVSLTVTIPKRVPLMPWIKIPPATITFQGTALIENIGDVPQEIPKKLTRGMKVPLEFEKEICVIRAHPEGEFVTYGVGVSLQTMRNPEAARGRAPIWPR